MKYKNSFFKLEIKDDGTYLRLFPAVSDGKLLEAKEIVDFLSSKNCDYELANITNALNSLKDKPIEIKLSDYKIEEFNESAKVTISPDKMVAFIRFYPPSTNGKLMSEKEIRGELEMYGIVYGISQKILDVFMMARQYCLNIPIAKGTKPVLATDTVIEYKFNTRPLAKPKVLEDGSVDFHNLNLFTPVKKGDVLAVLTEHKAGENGTNVLGAPVLTNKPKIKFLKYGKNISISEDKTVITSEVDGNVSFTDGTVFVSDTYKVPADVDASTGDIDYDGNVSIPGTVRTGFTVKAKGDIEVNGVVEGATLIAGGNIVIKRGVQGMSKGLLKAGGDICAHFFESANVEVAGSVVAGSILHSTIKSGGNVAVKGKKGFIVGGEVVCENTVEVNAIGNKMETQTIVKVGVKPELIDEMKVLSSRVSELNSFIEETNSYLNVFKTKVKNGAKLSPENMKQVKQYQEKLNELEGEKKEKTTRMIEIKQILDLGRKGTVKVSGTTYRGVTIFIASRIYGVKDNLNHTVFAIDGSDIIAKAF